MGEEKKEKIKHRWYHNPKKEIWHTDDEEAYIKEMLEWWDRIPDQRQPPPSGVEFWDYEAHDNKHIDELLHEEKVGWGFINTAMTFSILAVVYLLMYYLWIMEILG